MKYEKYTPSNENGDVFLLPCFLIDLKYRLAKNSCSTPNAIKTTPISHFDVKKRTTASISLCPLQTSVNKKQSSCHAQCRAMVGRLQLICLRFCLQIDSCTVHGNRKRRGAEVRRQFSGTAAILVCPSDHNFMICGCGHIDAAL